MRIRFPIDEWLKSFRTWCRKRILYLMVLAFFGMFFLLAFGNRMFFTIPSGYAGVVFRRFYRGTVTQSVRTEGFQAIPPWDRLILYDVRIQQVEHSFPIISSDGLEVVVTVSIRFQLKVELLGMLHQDVGEDYVQKIVIPEVQALIRSTFGQYTPEEMYTTKRSLIEQTLQSTLSKMSERYVLLDDLLIESIKLPSALQGAIEAKLVEQQRALEMRFRIEREKLEAQRKEIEAGGVAKFQQIVRQSINQELLLYKGIEATLKLAESTNTKVIIVGGQDGLPLILDTSTAEGLRWPGKNGHSSNVSISTNALSNSTNALNPPLKK
jgi:regulator of protease activity HflC (stomatin/prohibitin superfamily)